MNRENIARYGVDKNSKILEIAPYFNPMFPKSEGYNTDIADVMNRDELIEHSKSDVMINDNSKIEEVDFVCDSDYATNIGKKDEYDYIFASHVIEHTIDIIGFLNDCTTLLKDNGEIRLFIPDKRYDFDNFREVSTTRIAIDTHLHYQKGEKVHSIGTRVELGLRGCGISPVKTDIPSSAFLLYKNSLEINRSDTYDKFEEIRRIPENYDGEKYIDSHSWLLTPKSFETMIYELNIMGFIQLVTSRVYAEKRGMEFYVELKKGVLHDNSQRRKELYIERKIEDIEEFEDAYEMLRLEDMIKQMDYKADVFVYGTGCDSSRFVDYLNERNIGIQAFVVSDGLRTEMCHNGYHVFEISEIEHKPTNLIVVATRKYRDEIIKELCKRGFYYFF